MAACQGKSLKRSDTLNTQHLKITELCDNPALQSLLLCLSAIIRFNQSIRSGVCSSEVVQCLLTRSCVRPNFMCTCSLCVWLHSTKQATCPLMQVGRWFCRYRHSSQGRFGTSTYTQCHLWIFSKQQLSCKTRWAFLCSEPGRKSLHDDKTKRPSSLFVCVMIRQELQHFQSLNSRLWFRC